MVRVRRLCRAALVGSAISVVLVACLSMSYASTVPYRNYVYNVWGKPVLCPQAYLPDFVVDGVQLGIGPLKNPGDLFVAGSDSIYVADSGNNRIVCLDAEWNVTAVIDSFVDQGQVQRFANPSGIFVTESGSIYVADQGNSRIVELRSDGSLVRVIGAPRTDAEGVFSENTPYAPMRVAVNPLGRIFVIARHVYEGLMQFGADGDFEGFVGAPRVQPSVADIFWQKIASVQQRERMTLILPAQYNSLDVDAKGFVLACEKNLIRRLNSTGTDLLRTSGLFPPQGDLNVSSDPDEVPSLFVDIAARELGMYSVLDRTRGHVFTYDSNGNLLYTFGGIGYLLGQFRAPAAIDSIGEKLLVLDSQLGRITVFRPTEYARYIHAAMRAYNDGHYLLSEQMWREVLRLNANFDLAYKGIGKAYLREGDYRSAMQLFRLSHDRSGYSEAFRMLRYEAISRYLGPLLTVSVLGLVALYVFRAFGLAPRLKGFLRRRRVSEAGVDSLEQDQTPVASGIRQPWTSLARGIREIGSGLSYSLYVIFHPFEGFWSLKHERKAPLASAICMLVAVVITYIVVRQYTGFLFNFSDSSKLNVVVEALSVLVPFALWCLVNWALTTLMDGKGTLSDIFTASAFALTPLVLINLPLVVISNVITLEEGGYYYLFLTVAVLWSVTLLLLGSMTIHDYDLAKTTLTAVLTAIGMGSVLFIGLLGVSLVDAIAQLVRDLYVEIVLRV